MVGKELALRLWWFMLLSGFHTCMTLPFSVFSREIAPAGESGNEDLEQELEEEFELLQQAEETIFSAAKYEQKIGWSPAAVLVITREDIEASGAATLTELLRRYPALRVFESNPAFPVVEARGLYRSVLLIDGREVNHDIFLAPFYAFLPIGLQDIERVEIVLGPSSAIYGANAVSAVVNLITRPPEKKAGARAAMYAGEKGGLELDVTAEAAAGPWRGRLSVGHSYSDSWMERGSRGKNVWRALGAVELEIDRLRLFFDAGFSRAGGKIFALVGDISSDAFWAPHAQARLTFGNFFLRSYWYGYRVDLLLDMGLYYPPLQVFLGKVPQMDIQGDTLHNEAQLNLEPWKGNFLVLGADARYIRYNSDQLIPDNIKEVRAGVFFHDEQRLGSRLSLQIGLRYDWNSKTDQALSPRGAVIYRLADDHYLRLSGGLAFRKPTLLETNLAFDIEPNPVFPEIEDLLERSMCNPDLKNELLSSLELGWRGSFWRDRLTASVDIYASFNRRVVGFYTDVVFDQTPLGPRLNLEKSQLGYDDLQDDSNNYGAHINLTAKPLKWLEAFTRADLRYVVLTEQQNRVNYADPQYVLAFGMSLLPDENWRGQAVLAISGFHEFFLRHPQSVLVPPYQMRMPAFNYVMLYLGRSFKAGPLALEALVNFFNAFDRRFREGVGMITTEGRNFAYEVLARRFMVGLKLVY